MARLERLPAGTPAPAEIRSRLRTSDQPLYVSVGNLLRAQIFSGELQGSTQLPTIDDLSEQYGVAKVTVREAVARLADEGLVRRVQGKGTFVAPVIRKPRTIELRSNWDDLLQMLDGNTADLLDVTSSCTKLPIAANDGKVVGSYRFMRRLHRNGGVPYSVVALYVANRYYRKAPRTFDRAMVIPTLERLAGTELKQMSQSFRILTADLEVARLLDLPFNAPIGEVRRVITNNAGEILYLSTAHYRGDIVVFNTTMAVQHGAPVRNR